MHEPMIDAVQELAREVGPLLALDTSGTTASLCCVQFGRVPVRELSLDAMAQPSEALAKALADECAAQEFALARLAGIVIGIGPGSFTGLRVGLALAKGLALGAAVPLYGTSSLAMLAASCGPGRVATVAEARRGELFSALYDVAPDGSVVAVLADSASTAPEFAAAVQALPPAKPVRWCGSAALGMVRDGLVTADKVRPTLLRAGFGLVHVASRIRRHEADSLAGIVPSYLKLSEPERKRLT